MPEPDDIALLKRYAGGDEFAFATLFERYVNLVYSTALRQARNPSHAEEITQAVFILLARKAKSLSPKTVLSGWLYQAARLTTASLIKREVRRQRRDQEVYMQTLTGPDTPQWEQISPLLDVAMGRLGEMDRNAIVLRFFENRTPQQVAATLKLNEVTARKRVSRALEKLRAFFATRGVASTTAIMAGVISANSVQAAPSGLAQTVLASALAKGAAASTSTLTLVKGAMKLMAWSKTKTTIAVGAVCLLAAGTTTITVERIWPRYDPKTLNDLLDETKDYIWVKKTDTPAERRKKNVALKKTWEYAGHVGVRGIPVLLQWTTNTSGGGYVSVVGCFEKLGPEAKAAVPGLVDILKNGNEQQRYAALNVLEHIGPYADEALPVILEHLQNDPSDFVRSFAATTLEANKSLEKENPDAVVPVFMELLAPNNKLRDRSETLGALGELGTNAKVAIPAISPYLNDPDTKVRKAAAAAIRKINPSDAVAKPG